MTPRYRIRTLLILLAVLPPLLWFGWTKYEAWRAAKERREMTVEDFLRLSPADRDVMLRQLEEDDARWGW